MYYTGIHPLTGKKVYVPRSPHEKAIQRALMQYRRPENRELVLEGLKKAGRMDLYGYGPKCLIRPIRGEGHDKIGAGRKKQDRKTSDYKSQDLNKQKHKNPDRERQDKKYPGKNRNTGNRSRRRPS